MANIVITSTANSIKVEFNAYSSVLDGQEGGTYQKEHIKFYRFGTSVRAIVNGEHDWEICYVATTGCFIVDSVDGVAPSSNLNLYNLLQTMVA